MRSQVTRKNVSATKLRNLRTLLLLNVLEPEEIGDRIKTARERAGLTQEELGDLIEMSTRQVQNYEAGASKQYARLRSIAEATGSTVEWLLHGDEATSEQSVEGLRELRDRLDAQHDELVQRLERIEELARTDAARQT